MTWTRVVVSRLRAFLRTRRLDRDTRDEIAAHLAEAAEDHVKRGLSPADARRAAHLEFGSVVVIEEACRDLRGQWVRDLAKDFGYGLRTLKRSPAVATVAVVSLAIGIGANAAIFSVVNSTLLRPRAVSNPDELVHLYVGDRQRQYDTCSYPSYVDLLGRNEVFSGLAAYGMGEFRLGDPNEVEQVWGEFVSGNYFDVLGVRARLGRTFLPDDLTANGPVVVIGDGLWRRRFNSDPNAIGRAITIDDQRLTIVGIVPPHYTGMTGPLASEVWIPATMLPVLDPSKGQARLSRKSRWLMLVGRLQPETTLEQARAHLDLISREMQAAYPDEWKSRMPSGAFRELFVSVLPERDARIDPSLREVAYAGIALAAVVVNLVLLVACMNLASVLLARGVVRRKEIGVRLALGAGRLRIVRQLLVESVMLSLIAGACGLVLGVWLLDMLLASMPALPEGIRVALDLRLDWHVLACTMSFSAATGILFGLYPALHSSRTHVSTFLKDDSAPQSVRRSRLRETLIVMQVALSLLLLIGAGLAFRSLEKVRPSRLGFVSEKVVVASLTLDEARYDRAGSQVFYRRLSERISTLPGVRSVSLVEGMPGGFMSRSRRGTEIEGYEPAAGESLEIDASFVGPYYFTNMRVPIVQGRDFDERDREGAPCVAIVNEAFRRRYLPALTSPLGRHLGKSETGQPPVVCEIVGLVRDDAWQSLQWEARPFYWLALEQAYRTRMSLLVATETDPASRIGAVRRAVQEIDPRLPVADIDTLTARFDATAYPFRVLAFGFGASGVMALLLATIGIYGSVSYSVAQRTREVGIRMALGALRSDVVRMVARPGMSTVGGGLLVGLLLSMGLTGILSSPLAGTELLFGTSAIDVPTFAGVTAFLTVVALIACLVPAVRATRVNPVEALRYQ